MKNSVKVDASLLADGRSSNPTSRTSSHFDAAYDKAAKTDIEQIRNVHKVTITANEEQIDDLGDSDPDVKRRVELPELGPANRQQFGTPSKSPPATTTAAGPPG